MKMIQSH